MRVGDENTITVRLYAPPVVKDDKIRIYHRDRSISQSLRSPRQPHTRFSNRMPLHY